MAGGLPRSLSLAGARGGGGWGWGSGGEAGCQEDALRPAAPTYSAGLTGISQRPLFCLQPPQCQQDQLPAE